jgi:hypothetical protein
MIEFLIRKGRNIERVASSCLKPVLKLNYSNLEERIDTVFGSCSFSPVFD